MERERCRHHCIVPSKWGGTHQCHWVPEPFGDTWQKVEHLEQWYGTCRAAQKRPLEV